MNNTPYRKKALVLLIVTIALLATIAILGAVFAESAAVTDFSAKNQPPSWAHPFGTDWMGRDMLTRTIAGLSLSIRLGIVTALCSAVIALVLGSAAAMGRAADGAVSWLTDLTMGVPHILLLLLISFACGRGTVGVFVGITLTHWMPLARVIRAEILQLRQSGYVLAAQRLGVGAAQIARTHMLPGVLPQFITGTILLFPHVILHEASITFLGFGLPPETPAIGIILQESMRYLAVGDWWLAVFPGVLLVAIVLLFDAVGRSARRLADPYSAQR